jgi:hypothetical protein
MFVARIDSDSGLLDSTFGSNGVTIVTFGVLDRSLHAEGRGLIAQADGKLIAVGQGDFGSTLALARVDPAGSGSAGFAGFISTSEAVTEGAANLVVTVRRTGGSKGSLSVSYNTIAGTATAPGDFTAASGTLTWQSGDMDPKSIIVPITNDTIAESVERFSIVLTNSTGGLAASEVGVDITDSSTVLQGGGGGGGLGTALQGGGGGGGLGIEELIALALILAFTTQRRRHVDRGKALS